MSLTATMLRRPVLTDLNARPSARSHAAGVYVALVQAGVTVATLLAKASSSIGPVPITGKKLGVVAGGAALTTYMLAGLAGLPVFAVMAFILSSVLGQHATMAGVLEAGVWPFIIPGLIMTAAALVIPGRWLLDRAADRTKGS